jgi:hypothetical protein
MPDFLFKLQPVAEMIDHNIDPLKKGVPDFSWYNIPKLGKI